MNSMVSPSPSASPTLSKTYASFSPFFLRVTAGRSCKPITIGLPIHRTTGVRCNSSIRPGGPRSGDGDSSSRTVLDAFFLGKAVAEALNERVESTVGEILSAVGRLQAEQQKHVQNFQEDVFERAKKAKEKAAREALEAQALISVSAVEAKTVDSPTARPSNPSTDPVTSVQYTDASETFTDPANQEDPASSSANDD